MSTRSAATPTVFGGVTQNERYIAGKLAAAVKKAAA
jgi:hypothetical protein